MQIDRIVEGGLFGSRCCDRDRVEGKRVSRSEEDEARVHSRASVLFLRRIGGPSSVKAEDGLIWFFTTEEFEGCRPFTVQASYEGFVEGIKEGDELVVDGGMTTFEVIERIGNDLRCKCIDPGLLLPRAKLSFWRDGDVIN